METTEAQRHELLHIKDQFEAYRAIDEADFLAATGPNAEAASESITKARQAGARRSRVSRYQQRIRDLGIPATKLMEGMTSPMRPASVVRWLADMGRQEQVLLDDLLLALDDGWEPLARRSPEPGQRVKIHGVPINPAGGPGTWQGFRGGSGVVETVNGEQFTGHGWHILWREV